MRVAVFTSKYPARVATFFERDMRSLLEAGIEIDVFPIYPLDASLWRYALDVQNARALPRARVHHLDTWDALRGIAPWPVHRVGVLARDTLAVALSAARYGPTALAKTLYVVPKAWAWARQHGERYDHVLAYWGNYAGTCAYLFHRLIGRPIPFSIWLHAGTDLYYGPVYLRQKLEYADMILTCCEFNRGFLLERYADVADRLAAKIHVCYHGLDLSDCAWQPDGRPSRRVIGVGRLTRDKGFAFLLRAAHLLARRGVDLEVELVGDGEERPTLERLARDLGIADRVRFRGWLRFADVRAAMSAATVLVHPSHGLGDGLPNVLREAMALGTPVIASRVAGIPEALDDGRCGILVPPGDATALADAVATLLADSGLRRRLSERGRRWTETHFDMWRNGARLAERLRATRRATGPVPAAAASCMPRSV